MIKKRGTARETFIDCLGSIPLIDENTYYDLEIDVSEMQNCLNELEKYEPFGEGNKEPVFCLKRDFSDFDIRQIGDGSHLQMRRGQLKIIGFGCSEKWKQIGCPSNMCVVGSIGESWWKGRRQIEE